MDHADAIVTVGCGARRWRLEGFEDAFAALGALAPWLGETAAGGEPEAPTWARARSDGGEVVLRPAEGADARGGGAPDPATAPDGGAHPATAPDGGARPTGAGSEEEMLARLARMAFGEDVPWEGGAGMPGAAFAERPLPDAPATDPAQGGADGEADAPRAAPPEDPPARPRREPTAGPGEEMDRIVFRLAEATGVRFDARGDEGPRPPLRPQGPAASPDAAFPGAPGHAEPVRLEPDPARPVSPRRPVRRAEAGRATRAPASEGRVPHGVRPLPPLLLTEAHRVVSRPAAPGRPAAPVVPRRVGPRVR